MAAPLLAQYARRRRRFAARQLHARVRRGGRVRDDRRGGGRVSCSRRPPRWRTTSRSACIRSGEHVPPQEQVQGGAHRDGRRRRDGDRDRHRGQGPERRAPRGAGVRGGGVGQLPVRAADAVLEALQHRRHRARHDRRHVHRDRPRAGVAEHDVPEGREGGGAEDRRRRAARRETAHRGSRCGDATTRQRRRRDGDRRRAKRTWRRRRATSSGSRATTRRSSGSRSRCSSCAIPGLISIPLGFLAVILGSLLYRDKRAEDMWDELYARQNTGILVAEGRRALTPVAQRQPPPCGGFQLA